jgi:hypothetical protein
MKCVHQSCDLSPCPQRSPLIHLLANNTLPKQGSTTILVTWPNGLACQRSKLVGAASACWKSGLPYPFPCRLVYTAVKKCITHSRIPAQATFMKAMVATEDKMEKIKTKNNLKLECYGCQLSCTRVWDCPRNSTSIEFPYQNLLPCWHSCHVFHSCLKFSLEKPRL